MKFLISRTSAFTHNTINQSPFEGAEIVDHNKWGEPLWGIEINTLEELLSLQEKIENPIILFSGVYPDCDFSNWEIEIYDDDRE